LQLEAGQVLLWSRASPTKPVAVKLEPPHTERRRHTRKYAEGQLPADRSFYFRGPSGKLNLRAQNLILFMQLADGVDDATWMHHLRQGDYSAWFRNEIKDNGLADQTAEIERDAGLTPPESRNRIRALIEQTYTQPAGPGQLEPAPLR